MQGPKWVERNIDLELYRERCQNLHQKQLETMSKPIDIKKMAKTIEFELERKKNEKLKNHEFLNQERNIVINKHNQILLNKLVDISHGKWLSVQPKVRAVETVGPRSLNVGVRRRENERIERENQAFAKRLMAQQKEGQLSKKKMDEDFFAHIKYKRHIMKVPTKKRLPKMNGRHGLLPPLDTSADAAGAGEDEEDEEVEVNGHEKERMLSEENRQTVDLTGKIHSPLAGASAAAEKLTSNRGGVKKQSTVTSQKEEEASHVQSPKPHVEVAHEEPVHHVAAAHPEEKPEVEVSGAAAAEEKPHEEEAVENEEAAAAE